jgi:hypothetical protein
MTGASWDHFCQADLGDKGSFRIGAMVKVSSDDREVVATISAVRCESNSPFSALSSRIFWESSSPRMRSHSDSGGV